MQPNFPFPRLLFLLLAPSFATPLALNMASYSDSASVCSLASVLDDVAAQCIGAYLIDADAIAWAQRSRRSFQPLQRPNCINTVLKEQNDNPQ